MQFIHEQLFVVLVANRYGISSTSQVEGGGVR